MGDLSHARRGVRGEGLAAAKRTGGQISTNHAGWSASMIDVVEGICGQLAKAG